MGLSWAYTTWLHFGFICRNCPVSRYSLCEQMQSVIISSYTFALSFFNSWRHKIIEDNNTHAHSQLVSFTCSTFDPLIHTEPCLLCHFIPLTVHLSTSPTYPHLTPILPSCSCIQKRGRGEKGDEVSGVGGVCGGELGWEVGSRRNHQPLWRALLHSHTTGDCPPSLPPFLLLCLPRFPPGPQSIVPVTPLLLALFLKEQFRKKSKRCPCSLASSQY